MDTSRSQTLGFLLTAGLGAFLGGCIVLVTSKAIPKMMSRMMSEMMGNMMAQMGGEACDPVEL